MKSHPNENFLATAGLNFHRRFYTLFHTFRSKVKIISVFSVRIWWEILAKISLHWFNMASAPADQNYSRFLPNFTKCWYNLSRWVETVRCCRWCHWSLWDLDQKKGTVIFRLRLGTVGPSAKIKFLSWLP